MPGRGEGRLVVIDKNKLFTCPESSQLQEQMLAAVNRVRAEARTCGEEQSAAAPAVGWNRKLAAAAASHAADLAAGDFLSHTGSGGDQLPARVEEEGYGWFHLGENLAGGRSTPEEVVAGWLKSQEHCANLMNSRFDEIGAGCARNPEATYGTYWVLVFGAKRSFPPMGFFR